MSEKAKALVAETVDQLNKLPDSKKDKAKQMMVAFAAGIAIGAELFAHSICLSLPIKLNVV